MISINTLTTNMLHEQTYILSDETNECVIIDPGFYSDKEKNIINEFINKNNLKIKAIWFTHLHLDHMMGAQHILETYSIDGKTIPTYANFLDLPLLTGNKVMAMQWGIDLPDYDLTISNNVNDGDILSFGNSNIIALHVPGHSPGSIAYYSQEQGFCISGDVLFQCSIGRSDLYGGDGMQLIQSIQQKIMSMPDDTTIFPGHGHATTVDDEKRFNPYLRQQC